MQLVPSGESEARAATLTGYASDIYAVAANDSIQLPDVPYDVMLQSLSVDEIGIEANTVIRNALANINEARTRRRFLSIATIVSRVVTAQHDRLACEALLSFDSPTDSPETN